MRFLILGFFIEQLLIASFQGFPEQFRFSKIFMEIFRIEIVTPIYVSNQFEFAHFCKKIEEKTRNYSRVSLLGPEKFVE